MNELIKIKEFFYVMIILLFGNDIVIAVANVIVPIFYANEYETNKSVMNIYLIIIIIVNMMYCIVKFTKSRAL